MTRSFIAIFAVTWAWIQYTWWASAYDEDDWVYRLTTMVQMTGVVILALGLPAAFDSIDKGERLDNRVAVFGYVVMRVPMVSQWLRAAHQDPARRRVNAVQRRRAARAADRHGGRLRDRPHPAAGALTTAFAS